MAIEAPKCSICGSKHWGREAHKWVNPDDGVHKSVDKIRKSSKSVHNKPKVEDKVYTMRRVGIREFRKNMARELDDLPFELMRSGKVIAVVREK